MTPNKSVEKGISYIDEHLFNEAQRTIVRHGIVKAVQHTAREIFKDLENYGKYGYCVLISKVKQKYLKTKEE